MAETLESRTLLSGLSWTSGPPLPAAIGNAAALATSLGVLVVGGAANANGTTTPTTAQVLDPAANTWGSAPAIDRGRNGLGSGATGSYGPITSDGYKCLSDIFLFGGATQGQATSSVYNYDVNGTTGGEGGSAPSMTTARYDLASATDPAAGTLYAIGGLDSSKHALASVERYDPSSDSWSAVTPLPVALYSVSAASDGAGHILVFGGDNSAGTPVNTVYSYTVASDSWAAVSTMPLAASGTAAVFGAYGQIYLIGGLTAGGGLCVQPRHPAMDHRNPAAFRRVWRRGHNRQQQQSRRDRRLRLRRQCRDLGLRISSAAGPGGTPHGADGDLLRLLRL
ncbi:MAG: kelch repeat-containing protein [Tepidisphaeraceae bacterium]